MIELHRLNQNLYANSNFVELLKSNITNPRLSMPTTAEKVYKGKTIIIFISS